MLNRFSTRGWLSLVGVAAIGASVVGVNAQDYPLDQPCPNGVRQVPAQTVHLAPSVVRHQNWVGVDPSDLAAPNTWIYACTDGVIIGRRKTNEVDFDPASGAAEVKVATRWVDLSWLRGNLDTYRDPSEWTLVYTSGAELH